MNVEAKTLLESLNNLPLHILLSLLPFLDDESIRNIHHIVTAKNWKKSIDISQSPFLALV